MLTVKISLSPRQYAIYAQAVALFIFLLFRISKKRGVTALCHWKTWAEVFAKSGAAGVIGFDEGTESLMADVNTKNEDAQDVEMRNV